MRPNFIRGVVAVSVTTLQMDPMLVRPADTPGGVGVEFDAGDIAIGLSTSGNSKNVIEAVLAAKTIDIYTIGMTGRNGKLAKSADIVYTVESDSTARIQETHIILGHILCDLVDKILW